MKSAWVLSVIGSLLVVSLSIGSGQARTVDVRQVSEAVRILNRLLAETDNPIIAGFAHESLARLRRNVADTPTEPQPDQAVLPAIEAAPHRQVTLAPTTGILRLQPDRSAEVKRSTPIPQILPRDVEVPILTQHNRSIAVPVMLDRHVMATFLVDTGASRTVITPRTAKKLGIVVTPETPRIQMITANGPVRAPVVTVKHLAIGTIEKDNVSVVIQNLGKDMVLAGLLGMNFFEDMDFSVRQDKMVLTVSQSTPAGTAREKPLETDISGWSRVLR